MKMPEKRVAGRRRAPKSSSRSAVVARSPDVRDDLPDAQRAQDLARFSELLNEGYSESRLRSWMTVSAARKDFFAGLTLGTIRWPKSIGRPSGSTLAGGFMVQHSFYFNIWYVDPSGHIVEKEGWMPGLPVTVWDGIDDADHYRVNYLFTANTNDPNRVDVEFSKRSWQRPGTSMMYGYRWMHPHGFEFDSGTGFTLLPPIHISLRMLFRA